jgi:hypothetical protein
VDIEPNGNAFAARTRGVRGVPVLLSPDVIDFDKPISVSVNGSERFRGIVKKDVATLLRWGGRDNDRTMLYGAELKITLP